MGTAALLPLSIPLSAAWRGTARTPVCGALQDAVVEPMKPVTVKSVDDIPAVCLEDDLIAIFRLSNHEMLHRTQRAHPRVKRPTRT
jgi:hypothetical protein